MKEYLESAQSVLEQVGSTEKGLSSNEAGTRLEQNGKNKLQEEKAKAWLVGFWNKFLTP